MIFFHKVFQLPLMFAFFKLSPFSNEKDMTNQYFSSEGFKFEILSTELSAQLTFSSNRFIIWLFLIAPIPQISIYFFSVYFKSNLLDLVYCLDFKTSLYFCCLQTWFVFNYWWSHFFIIFVLIHACNWLLIHWNKF